MNRVGQVWENMAGLVVMVVSSSLDGRIHKVLVLQPWSVNRTDLQAGDLHEWTEDEGRPWEDGPSVRIA